MARKKKHAEHENHERWLVSYADLLTLLFALFVVLYAFATAKQVDAKRLVQGLMQSFAEMGYFTANIPSSTMQASPNVLSTGESSTEVSIPASKPTLLVQAPTQGGGGVLDVGASPTPPQHSNAQGKDGNAAGSNEQQTSIVSQTGESNSGAPFDKVRQDLRSALKEQISQGTVSFSESEQWLTIDLSSDLFFPAGSATILKRSIPVLDAVSKVLAPMNNYVRVRGYTDNSPTIPELYESNWALSSKRAEAVLKQLQKNGIVPERMAIEAYGEYAPFVSNSTEEGRKLNRKVAIAVSRYVREVKALEVIAPEATAPTTSNQQNTINPEDLRVIQLPDGRFKVENR